MQRVERYLNWDIPITEAYFPKLDSLVASRSWPARVSNQTLRDVKREADGVIIDVDDLKRWRDRIYDSIHSGIVRDVSCLDFFVNAFFLIVFTEKRPKYPTH